VVDKDGSTNGAATNLHRSVITPSYTPDSSHKENEAHEEDNRSSVK
jgi:hypothetical protein